MSNSPRLFVLASIADATTGKPLWNSGKTITTGVRAGLAGGQGNVYVPGSDGTLFSGVSGKSRIVGR